MKKIIWIGLIIIALVLGLVIGYTLNSSITQNQRNHKTFSIDTYNSIYASTSDCSAQYEKQFGLISSECEINSVHVGERFIDKIDCSCWQE